jgi:hypothetical protein
VVFYASAAGRGADELECAIDLTDRGRNPAARRRPTAPGPREGPRSRMSVAPGGRPLHPFELRPQGAERGGQRAPKLVELALTRGEQLLQAARVCGGAGERAPEGLVLLRGGPVLGLVYARMSGGFVPGGWLFSVVHVESVSFEGFRLGPAPVIH